MSFLRVFIMIIAAIGMIVGFIKQKQGIEWGKPLTVVCAVVALLLALSSLLSGGSESKKLQKQYQEWNTAYQLLTGEKIGQYITDEFGTAKIAILKSTTDDMDNYITGLRKGLGKGITIEAEVMPDFEAENRRMMEESGMNPDEMPMDDMYMMAMDPTMINPGLIDDALESADLENIDLVVSLIGLPYQYLEMDFWRDKEHPKFIAISVAMGMPLPEIKSMIKVGHITAWVINKPDGDYTLDDIPKDIDEAFNKRYMIIDADNVEIMAEQYPDLFGSMSR